MAWHVQGVPPVTLRVTDLCADAWRKTARRDGSEPTATLRVVVVAASEAHSRALADALARSRVALVDAAQFGASEVTARGDETSDGTSPLSRLERPSGCIER